MRMHWSLSIAALAFGCGTDEHGAQIAQPGEEVSPGHIVDHGGDGSGTNPPPPACTVSTAPTRVDLPPNTGASLLVANAAGEVAYSRANVVLGFDDNGPIYARGITKLDAGFREIYSVPYGSVVALDGAGDAFIAGSFTQPTDFGTGAITPTGNIDVFLVELSPRGDVIFAEGLGLCGAGVQSIALDRNGRIAVSGLAMGTAVLDPRGQLLFQLSAGGYVAFDSHGAIVVAGAFAGSLDLGGGHVLSTSAAFDVDGFVVKYDASGSFVFDHQISDAPLPVDVAGQTITVGLTQTIAGVATGPGDEIAITGSYRGDIDLFGRVATEPFSFPSGQLAGSFLAVLDASGKLVFAKPTGSMNAEVMFGGLITIAPNRLNNLAQVPGSAIAVDVDGNIVVSRNTPGNTQGPFAYPQLTRYDASGNVNLSLGNTTGFAGYGLGVAVDACANILWASFANDPSLFDPHTILVRLAP